MNHHIAIINNQLCTVSVFTKVKFPPQKILVANKRLSLIKNRLSMNAAILHVSHMRLIVTAALLVFHKESFTPPSSF